MNLILEALFYNVKKTDWFSFFPFSQRKEHTPGKGKRGKKDRQVNLDLQET